MHRCDIFIWLPALVFAKPLKQALIILFLMKLLWQTAEKVTEFCFAKSSPFKQKLVLKKCKAVLQELTSEYSRVFIFPWQQLNMISK